MSFNELMKCFSRLCSSSVSKLQTKEAEIGSQQLFSAGEASLNPRAAAFNLTGPDVCRTFPPHKINETSAKV